MDNYYREETELRRVALQGSGYSAEPHEIRVVCDDLVPGRLSRVYRYYRIIHGEVSFMVTQYTGGNVGVFVFSRPVSDLRSWWASSNSEGLLYASVGLYVAGSIPFDYRVLWRTRDMNSTTNMSFRYYLTSYAASTVAYRFRFVIQLSNSLFEQSIPPSVRPGNDNVGSNTLGSFSALSSSEPLQLEYPETNDNDEELEF